VSARRVCHTALPALVAAAAVISPRLARADAVLVILADAGGGSAAKNEVVNRVRGELIADGFRVQSVPPVQDSDRESALRQAGRRADQPIAAGFFVGDNPTGIDIYLLDTLSNRLAVHHVDAPPSSAAKPEVVARHAVDVLRANLLDFVIEALRPPVAPESLENRASETRAAPSLPRREPVERSARAHWAIEGGLAVLGGFEGVGVAVVPALGLRLGPNRTFQIGLTGAGLGSTPSVQAASGTATVQQGVVLLEGTAVLGHARWLRPLVAVGAGAYHASVSGSGAPPLEGQHGSAWALALDGAVGVATSLTSNIDLSLDLHALLTEPGIAIRFMDAVVARLGRPSLLLTFTVAGWI
jgi:hypothetical protein